MLTRTLKTVAMASVILFAGISASVAAQYATVKQNASVYDAHKLQGDIINTVWKGDTVSIADKWKDWYFVVTTGKDGWVRAKYLDLKPKYGNGSSGGSFCVNGTNVQFCISGGY